MTDSQSHTLPAHPGDLLRQYLIALGIDAAELARRLHLPSGNISELLDREAGMDANTALRVSHYFGNKPQFWLQLQNEYDLQLARIEHGSAIGRLPTINEHSGLAD